MSKYTPNTGEVTDIVTNIAVQHTSGFVVQGHIFPAVTGLACVVVGIWEYIQDVREAVHDLEQRLQRTKDNVEEMQSLMKSWATPLHERKEGKKETLLNLEERSERVERTYSHIRTTGATIHVLLQVSST